MLRRLILVLGIVGLPLVSSGLAVEPERKGTASKSTPPEEWTGRSVIARSPEAVLRERPDLNAPATAVPLTGLCMNVEGVEGEWLQLDMGWVSAAKVVRDDQAVEYFSGQLEKRASAFSYLGRARGWMAKSDIDKAQADIAEALRIDPQNSRAILIRAKIAGIQQRADEEQACYDRAVQLDPRDAVALKARGYLRSTHGDYEKAIEDYSAAIDILPKDAWLLGARGWCWATKGDQEKAIADLTEAIRLKPDYSLAFSTRAWAHIARQEWDEAMTDAVEAVRLDPDSGEAFAVRGLAQLAKNRPDEAIADMDKAIRLGIVNARLYSYRGRAHYLKGNLDAAVLDYTQAISQAPDSADLYFRRAEIWSHKRDEASAISDLTECLRLQPEALEAYVRRGQLRLETSLDEAMEDFQAALRRNPRHVDALINRAHVWAQKDDIAKALADLSTAIEINPTNGEAYRQRAGIRSSRREYDLAIEDLTAGFKAQPRKTDCLLDRAMAFALKGEYQKAIDDCRTALTIEPQNKIAYYHMATACSWGDRNEEAIQAYSAVLRIDPDDDAALMSRGHVAVRLRKFDMALADFDRLMKIDGHAAEAYRSRGQLWMAQQKADKAVADFSEAIKLQPDDSFAREQRAWCWLELKQFDKAIEDANEALRLDPTSETAASFRKLVDEAKAGHVVIERDGDGLPAVVSQGSQIEVRPIVARSDSKWVGKEVLPKTADVIVHHSAEQTIPASAAGILKVEMESDDVLLLEGCWLHTADAIPLDEAVEFFTKQIEKGPTAFAYAMRGRARADLQQIDSAITDCDAALKLEPHYALAYCYRGWAHAAHFDYELAETDYSEAIRLDPKLAAAYAWRGRARQGLGEKDLAIKDFDASLRLHPNDLSTQNHRSLALGEHSIAFSTTAPSRPRDAEDFYLRAHHRAWVQHRDDALDDLTESLRLGLKTTDVYGLRAMLYSKQGDFAEAIADYDVAVKLEPHNAALFANRGMARGALGEYSTSLEDFRRALDCDPQALTALADCWPEDGPFQERIGKSRSGDADLPLAYFVRAMMWVSKGEDEEAIDDLTASTELNPKLMIAYCIRGWLRQKAGQREEAMADFAEALRLDPDFAAARKLEQAPPPAQADPSSVVTGPAAEAGIAAIPVEAGAVDEAMPAAEASAYVGTYSTAGYGAGAPVAASDDLDYDKLAAANEALRKSPDDAVAAQKRTTILLALVNRALARSRAGQFGEAIRDLDEVLRSDPKNANHFQMRAQVWAESGDYARALDDYQEALRLADRAFRPMIHVNLARIWATCPDAKFRDGKRSVVAAKKSLRAEGYIPPNYYDTLAAAYAEVGDFAEAVKWQTKAIESFAFDADYKRELRERLTLYQSGKPYREPAVTPKTNGAREEPAQ